MARSRKFSDEEVSMARRIRDGASTARELRKALSVLLVAEGGLDAGRAAEVLGVSQRTLFCHLSGRRHCKERVSDAWGGRRHCIMTVEEEGEFLRPWEAKAMQGGVLSVPPIHAALVARLGRSIPISTTYRLLARHGWRKVQPDTKHPKSDPAVQEEFKKNFPSLWQPPVPRTRKGSPSA